MPRQARFVLPGVPHHITHRGVNRQVCFRDDQDHVFYLGLLEECSAVAGCRVHAYALMPNHVHVLATPEDEMGLFRFMKRVAQVYSQRHNRKNLRCGPVWEGRFKSTAIEDEAYLMRCYRYIELNPVRAGIVSAPERYRWSSFGYNAEPSTSWIVPHPLYLGLGNNPTERAARYRRFVEEGMTAEELQAIRFATRSSLPLGSRELRRRLAMQVRGTSPGTSPG